ncbi:peroxide stress protein YaaA [Pseudolysinimonas kribbensis]|uniref:Peroxide stress protein YaaA n=1 Tax=Pseudolysinimonas kribbensis TaxID=433641 RepID=A0ABQ6JZA8_9MICO|nr:peroxide stress protein YaaA [Pseudolysinimonas kribbensis]GMA93673.1 peroxide stress protein YaaA [Pseudolysinimonas kribbensis]
MLLLLPPSETKRDSGSPGTALDLSALSLPALTPQRVAAVAALRRLCRTKGAAMAALKLGPRLAGEIERNRALLTSPLLPAIDRFDGVLYDALDSSSLSDQARSFAGEHVLIASALFGMVGALDLVPAYRMSPDSRLPGMPLGRHWSEPVRATLAARAGQELVLDLRSEAYAALGPAPEGSWFVRVVADDGADRRRALNHFNKHGKGELVRRMLDAGIDHPDLASLRTWAAATGIRLEHGAPGELDLVV